jgi:hypothetical protein
MSDSIVNRITWLPRAIIKLYELQTCSVAEDYKSLCGHNFDWNLEFANSFAQVRSLHPGCVVQTIAMNCEAEGYSLDSGPGILGACLAAREYHIDNPSAPYC